MSSLTVAAVMESILARNFRRGYLTGNFYSVKFRRERKLSLPSVHIRKFSYEQAKERLEDESASIRRRALRAIIKEHSVCLQQRAELRANQKGLAFTVFILGANAEKSAEGYRKISGNPYHYCNSITQHEFDAEYPDRYETIAILEKIAGTSEDPKLRKMAREAIVDADVLARLATSNYEDTAVYAARALALYVRESDHNIGLWYTESKRAYPRYSLHLFEYYSYSCHIADGYPYKNLYGRELDTVLNGANSTKTIIAFLNALYFGKYRFLSMLQNEDVEKLLARKPELKIVERLEAIAESWNGRKNIEDFVQSIIDGLKRTENGTAILEKIGSRLENLKKKAEQITERILDEGHRARMARMGGGCDDGPGGSYGMDDGHFSSCQGGWGGGD